jgi:biopolymer transport protein ExbD
MVDVMFLLLVFYVLSSLALSQHKGIEVQLPAAQSGQASAAPQQVVITVNAQGEVYLMEKLVPLDQLGVQLQELCQQRPGGLEQVKQEGVVLNADQSSPMRLTVSVMDQLRQVGVYNFAISTQDGAKP